MKIKKATNLALKTLEGFTDYKAEAEWLVALSVGIKRSEVYQDLEMNSKQEKVFKSALKRREKGEPLAYIFKSASFYGYDFFVNKNVLIPRPETEELVNFALMSINKNSKVLDIGTGSGAIAITIAKEINAKVTAVDISRKALRVARKNAKLNQINVRFLQSNLFSKLNNEKFDVIISNPPYITNEAYQGLEKTVKEYEPKLALVGGEDGLKFYKKIIEDAHKHLNNDGKVFFEIGYDQADSVKKLLIDNGYKNVQSKKDLYGNDRIVYAEKGE